MFIVTFPEVTLGVITAPLITPPLKFPALINTVPLIVQLVVIFALALLIEIPPVIVPLLIEHTTAAVVEKL